VNRIDLTQAEWQLMEKLWDHAPQTGRELTEDEQKRIVRLLMAWIERQLAMGAK